MNRFKGGIKMFNAYKRRILDEMENGATEIANALRKCAYIVAESGGMYEDYYDKYDVYATYEEAETDALKRVEKIVSEDYFCWDDVDYIGIYEASWDKLYNKEIVFWQTNDDGKLERGDD